MNTRKSFKPGDRVRSTLRTWDDLVYVVVKNNNGWLTIRVADPRNSDLVYAAQRASIFVAA